MNRCIARGLPLVLQFIRQIYPIVFESTRASQRMDAVCVDVRRPTGTRFRPSSLLLCILSFVSSSLRSLATSARFTRRPMASAYNKINAPKSGIAVPRKNDLRARRSVKRAEARARSAGLSRGPEGGWPRLSGQGQPRGMTTRGCPSTESSRGGRLGRCPESRPRPSTG